MPVRKKPVTRAEKARITDLQTRVENTLTREFIRMVNSAKAQIPQHATMAEAAQIVEREAEKYADVVAHCYAFVGHAEMQAINRKTGRAARFNPDDPATARIKDGARRRFLYEFSLTQRASIAQAVSRGSKGSLGAAVTIQKASPRGPAIHAIGLTPTQEWYVDNYHTALVRGSENALERKLRDKRFDATVRRSIKGDGVLSADQIDRMTDRYRDLWIKHRARTIGRTEGQIALNMGRHAALYQASKDANYDPDQIIRTWNAVNDEATRDSHAIMDGQEVEGMDEPFESPNGAILLHPGDPTAPADEIVNCRCWVTYELPGEGEVDEDDLDEA